MNSRIKVILGALLTPMVLVPLLQLFFGEGLFCKYLGLFCGIEPPGPSRPVIPRPERETPRYDPVLSFADGKAWPQHIETEGVPRALNQELRLLPAIGRQIRSIAMDGAGRWLILHDSGTVSVGAPADLLAYLGAMRRRGQTPRQVLLSPSTEGWAVLDSAGNITEGPSPTMLHNVLQAGVKYRAMSVSPRAWALLRDGRGALYGGAIPQALEELLGQDTISPLQAVAMAGRDRWVAVAHGGRCAYQNLPPALKMQVNALCPSGRLRVVAFTPDGGGWAIVGDEDATPSGVVHQALVPNP